MKRILEGHEPKGAAQRTCSIVKPRRQKMQADAVYNQAIEMQAGAVYIKFFVNLLACALVYAFPKNPRPLGVLNFIEIHCKIYKKLSLSRNPNPYLVIPKVL